MHLKTAYRPTKRGTKTQKGERSIVLSQEQKTAMFSKEIKHLESRWFPHRYHTFGDKVCLKYMNV